VITITHASIARGYSGYDHLLDDSPLAALVGRTYRDLRTAARAAGRALKGTQDRRCAGAPVWLSYVAGGVECASRLWTNGDPS